MSTTQIIVEQSNPPLSPFRTRWGSELGVHEGNPDFVLSLARGLRVIECLASHPDGLTIALFLTRLTEVDGQRSFISGYWEFAYEDDVVPEVQERAARLGLAAFALAEQFRKEHGLTPIDQSEEWSTKNDLTRRHEKFVARRLQHEERQRKSNAEMIILSPNLL